METRTKHTYHKTIYDFVKEVLVVCPKCSGKAFVRADDFDTPKYEIIEVRIICSSCGFNKTLESRSKRKDPKQKEGNILIFGSPVDPFFHLPDWLQADFSSEILWAYNLEHIEFLAEHVGAKLRERNGFKFRIRSIGARLPRWMTSASNREAVFKAIEKLQEK